MTFRRAQVCSSTRWPTCWPGFMRMTRRHPSLSVFCVSRAGSQRHVLSIDPAVCPNSIFFASSVMGELLLKLGPNA